MTATFETQRAALADVVAIPVTPFAEDGTVDPATYRALLRRLLDGGITTLTPNGNTGEFYALDPAERRLVTELTIEETGERADILVGVGHDVPTAVASARHARDLGASMVMCTSPSTPTSPRAAGSTTTAPSPRPCPNWASSPTSATPSSPAPDSPTSPTPAPT